MRFKSTNASLLLLALIAMVVRADEPAASKQPPPYDWNQLDSIVGGHGELKDDVYTFTVLRDDLRITVEGMEVPASAGIASVFHFYRCPCGKIRVVGQFCCAEWEANDVIDAIRNGAAIQIAGVSPMFVGTRPQVTIVRFQGEGDGAALAGLLKSGLGWIGPARSTTQPIK